MPKADKIHESVRYHYGNIATSRQSGCCGGGSSCGGSDADLGYQLHQMAEIPAEVNMGLGCGNPLSVANLQPGETVLDLGSGGGIDCFMAAPLVGETGRVIGLDMTPEMVELARKNTLKFSFRNVEFLPGQIENIPLPDASVDVIISNCVINLSPDKQAVFNEAFRVLKPEGRLAIFDTASLLPLPEAAREDLALYAGCISGAASIPEIKQFLANAGFTDIRVEPFNKSKEIVSSWAPGSRIEDYITSVSIQAIRQ